MSGMLRLTMVRDGGAPATVEVELPVEFGRLDPGRSVPDELFRPVACGAGVRIAVADVAEVGVSRRQAVLTRGGSLRLENVSSTIPIHGPAGWSVAPGATVDVATPCSFRIGMVRIDVSGPPDDSESAVPRQRTESSRDTSVPPSRVAAIAKGAPDVREFVHRWQRVISLLQSASSSTDFFQKAAESLVDLVGLDLGAVFLIQEGDWRPAAMSAHGETRLRPSSNVLGRVMTERKTLWHRGEEQVEVRSSMAALEAYVAAPIMDGNGDLLGVLYGHRTGDPQSGGGVTELEALLVEALACGVAAGLARMEQEALAIRQKVTFSQFFSPELASRLESEPDLLRGRDAEISVLFCDIRGFSSVSERLGAAQTMDWIGDTLTVFSDRVAEAGGVLVDYVGDELMAMWGAPSAQPDHADLACTAARAMLASLPEIDGRWARVIGAQTRVGIGINSTVARVGNTGSTRKFKYGPLGNGVNIASRVQGATKFLRVDALITGSTRRLLGAATRVRRLCTVQVVNIEEPLELFELDCGQAARPDELFPAYEDALTAFEAADFSRAARLLGGLLDAFPGDGPSLVLLSRAVDAMVTEPDPFTPVWRLSGK